MLHFFKSVVLAASVLAAVSAVPVDEDTTAATEQQVGLTPGQSGSYSSGSVDGLGSFQLPPEQPTTFPEDPCSRAGGICMQQQECPAGKLAPPGLCPQQAALGVECCHGLSVLERRCRARGGQCRPKRQCGRQLWEEHATDCPSDYKCCVLVTV